MVKQIYQLQTESFKDVLLYFCRYVVVHWSVAVLQ